ncbi:MAG: hypothetical protein LAQ30_02340 [Acidobacteriia bacterium]|nr:hypothetical protein [Terriglobia bacterium]
MSRSGLKVLAIVLGLSIIAVLFAGLDNLPRSVRNQIDGERAALASAQQQVRSAKDGVDRDIQSEAALFAEVPAASQYPARFSRANGLLATASVEMAQVSELQRRNRRQDRPQVESLLSQERSLRQSAVAEAEGVHKDADHWVQLKQRLPQTLAEMERNHRAIHDYDLAALAPAVQKAESDWPDKKADLDGRLQAERDIIAESDRLWETTADARRQAETGKYAGVDLAALVVAAGQMETNAAALPRKTADLQSLTAQLYTAWDKVLVDMETRGRGSSKEYQQKIRTVKTQVADASSQGGATTSDERWVGVSPFTYDAMRNNLGMAVEHKSAGKYDDEAEKVAQPAGFAYMAPPGQSNRYGYWERRNGSDFWVFYGQYALLRDLLFNRNYRPLDSRDWSGYRSSQSRGQTYYGNEASGGQKYGTQSSSTQQSYSGSSYARSGGFKDSRYAAKPGGYRDSQYATPMSRNPGQGDSSPRSFGRNRPSAPSSGYRPSKPFSPPRSSPGRSFGRSFGRRR